MELDFEHANYFLQNYVVSFFLTLVNCLLIVYAREKNKT